MGAFDQAIPWSTNGARGCRRFLDRVWRLMDMATDSKEYSKEHMVIMHETIKKVGEDYENMKFNTAIAAMMTLVNAFYSENKVNRAELKTLLLLLSPVAPHICQEMWELCNFEGNLPLLPWPTYKEECMKRAEVEIGIQVNGKVRGRMTISSDLTAEDAQKVLPETKEIKNLVGDKQLVKLIYVPGRLCNIIVK